MILIKNSKQLFKGEKILKFIFNFIKVTYSYSDTEKFIITI